MSAFTRTFQFSWHLYCTLRWWKSLHSFTLLYYHKPALIRVIYIYVPRFIYDLWLHNLVSGKLWKLIGKKETTYYCVLSKRNLNSNRLKCFWRKNSTNYFHKELGTMLLREYNKFCLWTVRQGFHRSGNGPRGKNFFKVMEKSGNFILIRENLYFE